MFKKILLLFVLIIVVVAVSYYKTTIQEDRIETAYNDGMTEINENLTELQNKNDSLSSSLQTRETELSEAQTVLDTIRIAQTDSLKSLVEAKDQQLASITEKNKISNKTKATASKSDTTSSKHRDILAYYKKLYKALPNDLSAYERRIALSEIRQVSASKFQITVAKLNKIRQANNLNY